MVRLLQTLALGVCWGLSSLSAQDAKVSRLGEYQGYSRAEYQGYQRQSSYITTRDSVRLATDVYLPKNLPAGKKLPTILYLTRYVRSLEPIGILKPIAQPTTVIHLSTVAYFTNHGYAIAVVDVRGSGASSGNRMGEFSPEEIEDGRDVLDWITNQSWSDGKVGVTGISYLGTSALLLGAVGHPALKCSAPRSAIWDVYTDITHPGGIRQKGFLNLWAKTMRELDRNDFRAFGFKGKYLLKGINPVNGDRQTLHRYVRSRHNFDVWDEVRRVTFRDDTSAKWQKTTDADSPHRFAEALNRYRVPMYIISGWYDGAVINSSLNMFRVLYPQSKLLIGPWDHAQIEHISPFASDNKVRFSIRQELHRFFDYHLKGIENGIYDEPKSHLYIMGKNAEYWLGESCGTPVASLTKMESISYLQNYDRPTVPTRSIALQALQQACTSVLDTACNELTIRADTNAFSGYGARWNSMMPNYRVMPIGYPDRHLLQKTYLTLVSEPLTEDLLLFDRIGLRLPPIPLTKCDLTLFAYLEERTPEGKVIYITEGMKWLNMNDHHAYTKADYSPTVSGIKEIPILPTGYRVSKDSRLQITLTTADREHFDTYTPHYQPITFKLNDRQGFELRFEPIQERDFTKLKPQQN